MRRLKRWNFWLCLLLSIPCAVVAQSEPRGRGDPMPEYVSAVGMIVPALLYLLAAAWALNRRGIALALIASVLSCILIVIGMYYEAGLETGLIIYFLSAASFAANLLITRRRTAGLQG